MPVCHKCPWGKITPTSKIQRDAKLEACSSCDFEKMTPHNGMTFYSIEANNQTKAEAIAAIEQYGFEEQTSKSDDNEYIEGMIAGIKGLLNFFTTFTPAERTDIVECLMYSQSEIGRLDGTSRQAVQIRIVEMIDKHPILAEILKYTGRDLKKTKVKSEQEQVLFDF